MIGFDVCLLVGRFLFGHLSPMTSQPESYMWNVKADSFRHPGVYVMMTPLIAGFLHSS